MPLLPAVHIHVHIHTPGSVDHTDQLNRMENLMVTAAEQINALGTKVENIGTVLTDVAADFAAFRTAMEAERENLTEAGQAALDDANAKADALAARASELDVAVGDADGSDIPPVEPGDGEQPA